MWFVACHIEMEKKRKQTRCQVRSRNSKLTWEGEKERKEERIVWFVACRIERVKKRKQTS